VESSFQFQLNKQFSIRFFNWKYRLYDISETNEMNKRVGLLQDLLSIFFQLNMKCQISILNYRKRELQNKNSSLNLDRHDCSPHVL